MLHDPRRDASAIKKAVVMRKIPLLAVLATLVLSTVAIAAADKPADKTPAAEKPDAALVEPQTSTSKGSVSVEGQRRRPPDTAFRLVRVNDDGNSHR